jgi:hypothetical protein
MNSTPAADTPMRKIPVYKHDGSLRGYIIVPDDGTVHGVYNPSQGRTQGMRHAHKGSVSLLKKLLSFFMRTDREPL